MENTGYRPLISVVLPTYNHAKFLPVCIESVLSQSYSNLECIIVDDGSVDDTEAVVKKYTSVDERIKYYFQENQGPSAARNSGIEKATGEIITLLDADDWLNSKLYETQIQCILDNQLQDKKFVVYSDHKVVWTASNGKIVKEKLIRYGKLNKQELLKNMLGVERDNFPPLHFNCAIIKRDVFKNLRFTTTQNAYVDLECWYRILTSDTKFIYVPVVGMYYRRHQNFITSNRARMRKAYLKCIENIYKLNRDDLMYFRDMDEIITYFSIKRDKERLARVMFLLRNSPVQVYSESGGNKKKMLLILDKINLLSVYFYLLYASNILHQIKRKARAKIGEIYRALAR